MQLNKTTGRVDTSGASNTANKASTKMGTSPSAQNAPSQKVSPQNAKTSPLPVLPRSVSSLISSCGLPQDKLSASILSFARFFSLPLKSELMQDIRRQAFASASQSDAAKQTFAPAIDENGSSLTAKTREALSLAAAAAESKGVELSAKGLEAFAQAIDPEQRRRQDEGRGRREKQNKDDADSEDEKASKKIDAHKKLDATSACALKEFALESSQQDQLLSVLNKLPGKDGKRWIILPFDFCENGKEFKVSLRILLDGVKEGNRASCLALDIAESERRWLFVLEAANGLADRLSIHIKPELLRGEQETLARELSSLLEIKPERITINHSAENFPCESDSGEDLLLSINEAV